MPVAVKLFAGLKSRFGPEIVLDLPMPSTVSQIQERLMEMGCWTGGSRIAVNLSFAAPDALASEGDEVAVVPPVSGG